MAARQSPVADGTRAEPGSGATARTRPSLWLWVPLLVLGVSCCATAVIFIKLSREHPLILASYRTLLAALVLSPLYMRDCRRAGLRILDLSVLRAAALPGVLLAVHFVSWVVGARLTPAANSSLIVNMVPIALPAFLFLHLREKPVRAEYWGTALALSGLGLLAWSDFHLSAESLRGDLICFGSMLFYAWYLAQARRPRPAGSIWLYVVPVYAIAGLCVLALALAATDLFRPYAPREILLIAGLVLLPTVTGHTIINLAMGRLRGQTVALVNLGQVAFAALFAYPLLGELPHALFYPALLLIVAGAVVVIRGEARGRIGVME